MNQPNTFDAIIIGGGPAGSSAALRLLGLGHRIALVEKECFPRDQIGEALSPGIWNIFNFLQADYLLEKQTYLHELPARVTWDTGTVKLIEPEHRGPGVMVDRSTLDDDLIKLAVQRGLYLFQPAKFQSCQKVNGYWKISIKYNDVATTLNGKFILDARGRCGINISNRVLTAPATIALWTHIPAKRMLHETVVEALERGWLWGSPTPKGQFRIMAFTDPKELKNNQAGSIFKTFLAQSKLFKLAIQDDNISGIHTCLASTYFHTNPWEDNYVRLGESAFSLDPLSSTGVEKAMRFSIQAAVAVNTVLKDGEGEISKSFYEDRMIETIVSHITWTKDYYNKAWPGTDHSFWRSRSLPFLKCDEFQPPFYKKLAAQLIATKETSDEIPQISIDVQKLLPGLWNNKISVSSQLTYISAACVVDSHLEMKTAIVHPRLKREIAYLDQIEITPLLMMVEPAQTFGAIVHQWSNRIPLKQAISIAIFLWDRGIFFLDN